MAKNTTNNLNEFYTRINKTASSNELKCALIVSSIGINGVLVNHILQTQDIKKLPLNVAYSMSLACSAILMATTDRQFEALDLCYESSKVLSEQGAEELYRKMKLVVTQLYDYLKEFESV